MNQTVWTLGNCSTDTYRGSYQVEQCLKSKGLRQTVMEQWWSSAITEADFAKMSASGINLVRLPVGWWSIYDIFGNTSVAPFNNTFDGQDYQSGSLKYIDKAFQWGHQYGIAILLEMHAAPGSQNGDDHSAPGDHSGNHYWDGYVNNQDATVDSIRLYAQRYGKHPALWGFGLLNEPKGDHFALQRYYAIAYSIIRQFSHHSNIVLNPLIAPFEFGVEGWWVPFMKDNYYTNIWLDLHLYSCFGGPADQPWSGGAIGYVNWDRYWQIKAVKDANPTKKVIVGEWSAGNNFGDDNIVGFTNAQLKTYGTGDGFTFWNWNGNYNAWNFQYLLAAGIDKSLLSTQC